MHSTEEIFGVDITQPCQDKKRKSTGVVQVRDKHAILTDFFYSAHDPVNSDLNTHLLEFAKKATPLSVLIGDNFGFLLRPFQTKIDALSRVPDSTTPTQATAVLSQITSILDELNLLHTPKCDASLSVVPFPDHVIDGIRSGLASLLSLERKSKVMVRNREHNTPEDESFVHGLFVLTTLPRYAGVHVDTYGKNYWLVFQFHEALRRGNPDLTCRNESRREWRDITASPTKVLDYAAASLHTAIKQKFCVCIAGMMRVLYTTRARILKCLPPDDRRTVCIIKGPGARALKIGEKMGIKKHRREWPHTKPVKAAVPKKPTANILTDIAQNDQTLLRHAEAFCACPKLQMLLFGRPDNSQLANLLPVMDDINQHVRLKIHVLDYKIAVSRVFSDRIAQEKERCRFSDGPSAEMDKALVSRVKTYLTTVPDALFFGTEILTNLDSPPGLLLINSSVLLGSQHCLTNSQYNELFGLRSGSNIDELEEQRDMLVEKYKVLVCFLNSKNVQTVPDEILAFAANLGKIDSDFYKAVRSHNKSRNARLVRLDKWITGKGGAWHMRSILTEVITKTWGISKSKCSSANGTAADGSFFYDVVAIAIMVGSLRNINITMKEGEARRVLEKQDLVTVADGDPHITSQTISWPLQPLLAELALSCLKGGSSLLTGSLGRPAVVMNSDSAPVLTDEMTSMKLFEREMQCVELLYGKHAPGSFAAAVAMDEGGLRADRVFSIVKWMDRRTRGLFCVADDQSGVEASTIPFVHEHAEASNVKMLVARSTEPVLTEEVDEHDLFGNSEDEA